MAGLLNSSRPSYIYVPKVEDEADLRKRVGAPALYSCPLTQVDRPASGTMPPTGATKYKRRKIREHVNKIEL